MYSDKSDVDEIEMDEQALTKTVKNAQVVVDRTRIVATQTGRVVYILHPDGVNRKIKGGYYISRRFGQVTIERVIEQAQNANGQTMNLPELTAIFQFNDWMAWAQFVNDLVGAGYAFG